MHSRDIDSDDLDFAMFDLPTRPGPCRKAAAEETDAAAVSNPNPAAGILAPPERDAEGELLGGGKGWPGIGYTFVVPALPAVVGGKLEVYRIWGDHMRTWQPEPTGPVGEAPSEMVFSGLPDNDDITISNI